LAQVNLNGLFKPPLPNEEMAAALASNPLGQELARGMGMSCAELLDELFENEKVKIHLMKWMGIFLLHPFKPGTGVMLYAATAVAHTQEESGVYGGAQAFSDPLGACITSHGGEIRTNAYVRRVLMSAGVATGVELADGERVTATKAVIGNIHPHRLGDMIPDLDPDLVEEARRCALPNHSGILTHWALHESPHTSARRSTTHCSSRRCRPGWRTCGRSSTMWAPASCHTGWPRSCRRWRSGIPRAPQPGSTRCISGPSGRESWRAVGGHPRSATVHATG
jgi:phytoene dehydrogenase-like protein